MPVVIHVRREEPFVTGDLERALRRGRVAFEPAQEDEGALWARYPLRAEEVDSRLQDQKGQLWFRAALAEDGAIALSVSYSNVHVVRNVVDLVRRAPKLAEALGARAFASDREIIDDDVDALVDASGPLVTKLVEGHRAAVSAFGALPLGAIEVPTGSSGDFVEEYALFEAITGSDVTIDELVEGLAELPGTSVERSELGLAVFHFGELGVYVRGSARSGARVARGPGEESAARVAVGMVGCSTSDGVRWQIRPAHGRSAWPTIAKAISTMMSRFTVLGSATLSWQGQPLDESTYRGFQSRLHGSALEFAIFARAARPNARIVEAS